MDRLAGGEYIHIYIYVTHTHTQWTNKMETPMERHLGVGPPRAAIAACMHRDSPPVSGILQEVCGTNLPREGQSTHTCLMEVENTVSGVIPEYPIHARLG